MNQKIFFILLFLVPCKFFPPANASVAPGTFQHNPYPGYQTPTDEEISQHEKKIQEQEKNRREQIKPRDRFNDQPQPVTQPIPTVSSWLKNTIPNAQINFTAQPVTFTQDIQQEVSRLLDPDQPMTENTLLAMQNLQTTHQQQFQEAMVFNAFAMKTLTWLLNDLQAPKDIKIKEELLCFFLQYCSINQLEAISPYTGQCIVHQSVPWHWMTNYIKKLSEKIYLDIPTQHPDKHPGSTIFHLIAQQLTKAANAPVNSRKINSCQGFLREYLPQYPMVLIQSSLRLSLDPFSQVTCWDLLPENFRLDLYKNLSPEIIQAIHKVLDKHSNPTFRNAMKLKIPLKKMIIDLKKRIADFSQNQISTNENIQSNTTTTNPSNPRGLTGKALNNYKKHQRARRAAKRKQDEFDKTREENEKLKSELSTKNSTE